MEKPWPELASWRRIFLLSHPMGEARGAAWVKVSVSQNPKLFLHQSSQAAKAPVQLLPQPAVQAKQ